MVSSLACVWTSIFVSIRSESIWVFDSDESVLQKRQTKGMFLVSVVMFMNVIILLMFTIGMTVTENEGGLYL